MGRFPQRHSNLLETNAPKSLVTFRSDMARTHRYHVFGRYGPNVRYAALASLG
ncbi:Uncharacterised protein [Vibrio cholerae]|nr:Uncharacterised protein [Vibrio cholerae]